ncbi:MAG TPA: L,D-transpeptidase family protein [Gemmatimonadaceae bacterium]|nr:L,D-transpeptidase family protein [Gemmatimonadaceae bacterium]
MPLNVSTAAGRRGRGTRAPLANRTALAGLLVVAILATGACKRDERGGDDAGRAPAADPWSPSAPSAVRGVPIADVRQAIVGRLAADRPQPLDADQWRHAKALYQRYGGGPLWLDKDGTNEGRARALLRALADADRDALRLDAYPFPSLVRAVAAIESGQPTAAQLAEADVMLTSAYAALGENLLRGQISPRSVSQDWHIDPREDDVDSALVRSMGEKALDKAIARMHPEDADYEALRKALVRYRELAAKGGWPTVPAGRDIKPGEPEKVARLDALRARLAAEGLIKPAAKQESATQTKANAVPPANAIGGDPAERARRAGPAQLRAPGPGEAVYDAALAGAVATYQERHAIVVDSVLGEETVKSMNLPASYRLAQIAANLERYRWMPRSLGARYILVNVPAFHLEAWDGGKRALDMKVIVGQEYEDKKTAVFSDTMTTVVFRPYWNITDDIAAAETWPKIQADPGYMAENQLETYQENGKTRLRQKPGAKNSLGYVKFLFPNDFNIYLHDTPDHQLFEKDVRAFSHGCIRLEKPAELAQWVLGWPADSVDRAMRNPPDDKSVKVARPIPVYITYFTTFVQNGELHFGNDLYGRDAAMVKAMQAESGQKPEVVQAVEQLRKMVAD